MIHLRIHSIVRQKYSFKEFIHSKIIKKYSFKEFIHSKKIQNYSFKEFIHSRKSKIIHSKKIFIQVKNRLSPRASHSWWQTAAAGDSQLGGSGHPSGALVVAWLVLPKVADE